MQRDTFRKLFNRPRKIFALEFGGVSAGLAFNADSCLNRADENFGDWLGRTRARAGLEVGAIAARDGDVERARKRGHCGRAIGEEWRGCGVRAGRRGGFAQIVDVCEGEESRFDSRGTG